MGIVYEKLMEFYTDFEGECDLNDLHVKELINRYGEKLFETIFEKYKYSGESLQDILLSIKNNIHPDQINKCIYSELDPELVLCAIDACNAGMTDDYLEILLNPNFEWEIMDMITKCFRNNIDIEIVKSLVAMPLDKFYDCTSYTPEEFIEKLIEFKDDQSLHKFIKNKTEICRIDYLIYCLEWEIDKDKIERFIDPDICYETASELAEIYLDEKPILDKIEIEKQNVTKIKIRNHNRTDYICVKTRNKDRVQIDFENNIVTIPYSLEFYHYFDAVDNDNNVEIVVDHYQNGKKQSLLYYKNNKDDKGFATKEAYEKRYALIQKIQKNSNKYYTYIF